MGLTAVLGRAAAAVGVAVLAGHGLTASAALLPGSPLDHRVEIHAIDPAGLIITTPVAVCYIPAADASTPAEIMDAASDRMRSGRCTTR